MCTQLPIAQRLRPNQVPEPNVGTERGCVLDDAPMISALRLSSVCPVAVLPCSRDRPRCATAVAMPASTPCSASTLVGRAAARRAAPVAVPADLALCDHAAQNLIYGLPAFRYGNMTLYVGFLTRYRCAPEGRELQLWFGGHISGELAYSYDGLAWRRLGQTAAPTGELRLMD